MHALPSAGRGIRSCRPSPCPARTDRALLHPCAPGQRHVQEIIKRCQSAEDLQLAVNAMDKLMRFRRAEQHHKAFNTHTGKMFVEVRGGVSHQLVHLSCCGPSREA